MSGELSKCTQCICINKEFDSASNTQTHTRTVNVCMYVCMCVLNALCVCVYKQMTSTPTDGLTSSRINTPTSWSSLRPLPELMKSNACCSTSPEGGSLASSTSTTKGRPLPSILTSISSRPLCDEEQISAGMGVSTNQT